MSTEPDSFAPVTTWSRRKRHWGPSPMYHGSRTLCSYTAYDQVEIDRRTRMYAGPTAKSPVIADLPPCKQCDKSKQRHIDGRTS